jgi:hypothetical protein
MHVSAEVVIAVVTPGASTGLVIREQVKLVAQPP